MHHTRPIPPSVIVCLLLLLATGPLASAADSPPPAELVLADSGTARLPIVVADGAAESTQAAARELAAHLHRITGAAFAVQTGDGARGIVVGTLAEFPDTSLQSDLEIREGRDGVEAFAIRTDTHADRLRLIGATELGASHAVFRFLEAVGCRWFFPAPEWHVVPSRPRLAVRIDESDRPKILSRRIWYGYGYFDRREGRCQADYESWARRNRMAQSRRIWCGHAWQTIIRDHQATFDAHPEYLALVKDERRGPQLCVSQPAVRQIAARWALDQLRRRPELDMVSLEPSDGTDHCQCADCQAMGRVSDRVFGLANEVAQAVAREFPGKMVGLLAYSAHCEPPSFPLEANVYVQSTAGFIHGRYTFDELIELWPQHGSNMGFYEYFSVWLWDFDMPPGGRGANVDLIRRRIRQYAQQGATSLDCESGNNWGLHGRGYYLANRLMWNPDADVDALLDDFYQQAFGPAAEAMRRYYERLDPGSQPLVSEHLLALALRDLHEASRLAADRPDVLARIDHLKQYQHYVRLRWEHDRAEDRDAKQQSALDALTHVYRTRYSYMNHWEAIRQSWVRKAAEEFDSPGWALETAANRPPWQVDAVYTREETEVAFQDDMNRFQPAPVAEREFSLDLVPSSFRTDAPAESFQRFQRGARYALYSRTGEPLELAITTGIIAWYRDRPDARYAVSGADGQPLAAGRLPQDGQEHPLRIEVPSAGLYWLDFEDQSAAWGLRVAAGRPVSLALTRGSAPQHLGHMQRMYFYVPQGTRRIDYFWNGGPHVVHGPDGETLAEIKTRGKFVAVDVPEGTAGQVWSFSKLSLGQLWFFNLPNYLAASPDALLLPRDAR